MEDWRWRMVTPLKGDAASVPVNAAARAVIDAWDPGQGRSRRRRVQSVRRPGAAARAGTAAHSLARRRHARDCRPTPASKRACCTSAHRRRAGIEPSRQGYSRAGWSFLTARPGPRRRTARHGAGAACAEPHARGRDDAFVAGLPAQERHPVQRRNDRAWSTSIGSREPDGTEWFTVTTIVTDPVYLGAPFVTTTDFRKERDGSQWNPRPCTAR